MSQNKSRVAVKIHGQEYVVRGEETAEYIETLAARIDRMMTQIGEKSTLQTGQIAVLTALNLADELEKLRQKHAELLKMVREGRN
ncbi:cell division protein ZapA [Metallumcola ferriviriculae]|uniref:Cell division protein ZapA n=1 Tax=Metallumcola ferriviriculae TaxID=3039180 RepID=A0AAU0UQ66_9FIRM|nr:cell division protein ZapA [Desulfitibacteraceae bacterium MK1]